MFQAPDISPHADDIAARNLACALGLPGTEDLDCSGLLLRLDTWARFVGSETHRLSHIYHRTPQDFSGSMNRYRMEVLTTVLERDLGAHYRQESIELSDKDFFTSAENLFIHGVLRGSGGTCASLPVIFVAVGRRLGYPLTLVQTYQHVFARWHEPGERFNIECTARGYLSHPDEYYLNWPRKLTSRQVSEYGLLCSLTKDQETGVFWSQRGHCFSANGNVMDTVFSYASALDLAPQDVNSRRDLEQALKQWDREQQRRLPIGFPPMRIHPRINRFPRLPKDAHTDIGFLFARHLLLNDPEAERRFWGPLRRDPTLKPPRVPAMIEVDYNGPVGRDIIVTLHEQLPSNFSPPSLARR